LQQCERVSCYVEAVCELVDQLLLLQQ
jgi:hypothetical protein